MKFEHRGYVITFCKLKEMFVCEDLDLEAPSLPAIKKKITEKDTFAQKLTPIKVFKHDGWGENKFAGMQICEVSKIADKKFGNHQEVWVQSQRNGREKTRIQNLYPMNDDVLTLIAKRKEISQKLNEMSNKLEAEFEALKVTLDVKPFTVETLQSACADEADKLAAN
jgi:hypothetical protein